LTPHSRKKFKFIKKQREINNFLEEIAEEQPISFPGSRKNASPKKEINLCEEIKKLEQNNADGPKMPNFNTNDDFEDTDISPAIIAEKEKNETLKVKSHCMGIGRISNIMPATTTSKLHENINIQKKSNIIVRVNLKNENDENLPQAGLEATEDTNLSETRKFDQFPQLNKTLKSKALVCLNSRNRQLISETHADIQTCEDEEKSRNSRLSINAPKSFEKNMKRTSHQYLQKVAPSTTKMVMKKKNLKIEIPEIPKEDQLAMDHEKLVSKLRSYLNTKSDKHGNSSTKKKTQDVDINEF